MQTTEKCQSLTHAEAVALAESKFWEQLSYRDRAMFQLFEERLCMPFDVFHEAIEKALGRPVWTHEFGLNRDGLMKEMLGAASAPTFDEILQLIPEEKRLAIVVRDREENMNTTAVQSTNEGASMSTDSLFITVPDVTLPNGVTVPSFQIGKYLCSQDANDIAVVNAHNKPWVKIDFDDAKKACEAAGFKLVTELQMLALAHDIAGQDVNWTGGKVGDGSLHQGLHKWSVSEAQAGDYEPEDPYERRWFQLSNGERIFDVAGNAYTWVIDDVQGDAAGLIARPFAEDSPSITTTPFPRMEKGVGWYPKAGADWSGIALIRGGCWGSDARAGVFRLGNVWPGDRDDSVGFRCTK